jgi:MFS family permease
LLALIGKPEPWMLAVWLAVFGFLPAYLPVLIAHGRSLLPPHLVGRGMTLFNIGSMGGTFVVQLASGALIDVFAPIAGAYPLEAYRTVFAAQALVVLAVCGVYALMRPKKPVDEATRTAGGVSTAR